MFVFGVVDGMVAAIIVFFATIPSESVTTILAKPQYAANARPKNSFIVGYILPLCLNLLIFYEYAMTDFVKCCRRCNAPLGARVQQLVAMIRWVWSIFLKVTS
jgi:hypothetical protein